ncbi:MAG: arginine--tRNA ligase [Planctomycetes bacterium]|nr:arginine--tRNA ligase [Planctomycetota bacterium]
MSDFAREHLAEVMAGLAGIDRAEALKSLTVPREPSHGDYAFPCFRLGKNAPAVSADLAARFKPTPLLARAESKGPFLNFFLEPTAFAREVLTRAFQAGDAYGSSSAGAGKTVVLDYSAPNIAKPFSIGHLRSTVIGGALYRLFQSQGYRVVGINHLGDWGTQFGSMMYAWGRWGDEAELAEHGVAALKDLYVLEQRLEKAKDAAEWAAQVPGWLEDGVALPRIADLYRRTLAELKAGEEPEAQARAWFRRLETGDPEARALWDKFRAISLSEFDRVYRRLGIHFDEPTPADLVPGGTTKLNLYLGESFYNDKMEAVVQEARARNLAVESQGALIIDLEKWKMPPVLLLKSDGGTTYHTRDLASATYRAMTFGVADGGGMLLYVVGADQRDHFRQLFKALELLGLPWAKDCRHLDFGLVRMKTEEGASAKMSTRRGRGVLLADVLDRGVEFTRRILEERNLPQERKDAIAQAVGVGAVVFNDFKARRGKDVDFEWSRVLDYDPETKSFKGETGPYLQYMHTRLTSILRKYDKAVVADVDFARLSEPEEAALVKLVHAFPGVLRMATEECEPSIVAGYVLDVAGRFSSYYHDRDRHKVISEDAGLSAARVLLCAGLRQVLASGLRVLGVTPLEEM